MTKSSARTPTHGWVSMGDRLGVLGDILLLAGGLGASMLSGLLALGVLYAVYGSASLGDWNPGKWISLVCFTLVAPLALIGLSRRAGRPILAIGAILGTGASLFGIWFLYQVAHFRLM